VRKPPVNVRDRHPEPGGLRRPARLKRIPTGPRHDPTPPSALVALALALPAAAQDKKPVRLIAEAEDFAVKSKGWKVVPYRENYYCGSFAVTFPVADGCLGADEQLDKPAVAEQVVQIPTTNVRRDGPVRTAVPVLREFTVEVEQAERCWRRSRAGDSRTRKSGAERPQRVPMERYSWSGTDNIVWHTRFREARRRPRPPCA